MPRAEPASKSGDLTRMIPSQHRPRVAVRPATATTRLPADGQSTSIALRSPGAADRTAGARAAHAPATGRLPGVDQAQGPVTAAAEHDRDDVRRRRPLGRIGRAHVPRRLSVRGRRRRREPLVRPRHRRAHDAHRDTADSRGACVPDGGARVWVRAGRAVLPGALADRQRARREPLARGLRGLRPRLHHVAEAPHAA
jgi:hypothetical protein